MYYDASGHIAMSTIVLLTCIGVGVLASFGAVAYIDYKDDDVVFNGSVCWKTYFGGALLGGVVGGAISYFSAPWIASLLTSTGSIGGGLTLSGIGATIGSGFAISSMGGLALVGMSVLTGIGAFGINVMLIKGFGPRIGHNKHEKQMWDEAMRRLGIKDKDLIRRLHNEIHKYHYADTLKKLLEILKEILEKMGY